MSTFLPPPIVTMTTKDGYKWIEMNRHGFRFFSKEKKLQ
jgi:hypothetical protein